MLSINLYFLYILNYMHCLISTFKTQPDNMDTIKYTCIFYYIIINSQAEKILEEMINKNYLRKSKNPD